MKWRILRWRLVTAIVLVVPLVGLAALLLFTYPSTSFGSGKWKSGNRWSRGAMTQDLIDQHVLIGKSRSQVLDMLGEPDHCGFPVPDKIGMQTTICTDPRVNWFSYNVVTISRCNFWKCSLGVSFNDLSYRVEELAVSD